MNRTCPECGTERLWVADAFCPACGGELPESGPAGGPGPEAGSAGDYTVEVSPGATAIRPSPALARRIGVVALVPLSLLALVVWAVRREPLGACCVLPAVAVGGLGVYAAVRGWAARADALVVEALGRVTYRGAELVPAAAARRVLIAEHGDSESSPTYALGIRTANGAVAALPAPYFSDLDDRAAAVWLAARLGDLLEVGVGTA